MTSDRTCIFDAVGVGLGPFNLSTAALLEPVKKLNTRFFEREKEFQWHPGLLFPDATIQVSFLKDLVTLADPQSRYSFLSFLFANRRLYRFINANFTRVSRVEFNQYFRWVANRLPNLEFGQEVHSISVEDESFIVCTSRGQVRARNIVLGTGLQPTVPECAVDFMNAKTQRTLLHASKYLHREPRTSGMRVVVVGGGQTGAEIVQHLLSNPDKAPKTLFWVSKRSNFLPLDESPFTNELFTPNYSDYFYGLSAQDRVSLLAEQKFASDGISNSLLERIYQLLYQAEFLNGSGRCCSLYPRCDLVGITPSIQDGWILTLRDGFNCVVTTIEADVVIFATGSMYKPLPALSPIMDLLARGEHGFIVQDDYSIQWDGPPSLKIYIQNGAKQWRGVADPNLSLIAWRSAKIINSLAAECIYDIAESNSVFDFTRTVDTQRSQENDDKSDGYFSQTELSAAGGLRRRHVSARSPA
ncbi:MAG: SidA/IucD/PvdA family monooxygenase [Acidobacteriia bacterium]|nr:SidA/IucD/PvdA family monooxygenase [Terriglobia bacterium]